MSYWLKCTVVLGFIANIAVFPSLAASQEEAPSYELKTYRFHRHAGFDRLVFEFKPSGTHQTKPTITVGGKGSERTVMVKNASWEGAIPEAAVNDIFSPHAKHLSSISIDAENDDDGFTVKAKLKGAVEKVVGFWLESPSRLVIDVFSAGARGIASNGKENHVKGKKLGGKKEKYICFPGDAKLSAMAAAHRKLEVSVEDSDDRPEGDEIYCYPRSQQITAKMVTEPMPVREAAKESEPLVEAVPMAPPAAEPKFTPPVEFRALTSEPKEEPKKKQPEKPKRTVNSGKLAPLPDEVKNIDTMSLLPPLAPPPASLLPTLK